jgi:AhpD family alkylhydroperoxidase
MKLFPATIGFAALMIITPFETARAQDVPQFMKQIYPEQAVTAAWNEFQALMGPNTALDSKTKELIGLGVAAQIPCEYCIYYHTKAAKEHGATDAQIKEALASAALVRKWSTMLNGSTYNREQWRKEVDAMFAPTGSTSAN